MPSYSLHTISEWVNGQLINPRNDIYIEHILVDSRKLVFPDTSLFFALNTGRRNGHAYISDLYDREVRSFVLDESIDETTFPEASFVKVSNALEALQQLVTRHRKQFHIPVIGITGSNGKTIVKEWLNYLLEKEYHIIRSPKSYNWQIGVPLSVWPIEKSDQLGIFEAGISQPGEMEKLQKMMAPTIGIITNLGEAHDEGFASKKEKLHEKLKLFKESAVVIYCKDHQLVQQGLQEVYENAGKSFFSWGENEESDVRILQVTYSDSTTTITLNYQSNDFTVEIPFSDLASLENAMFCVTTMLHFGYEPVLISKRLTSLPSLAMRLEMKQAINRCLLINDSYSADWNSFIIALDFLSHQHQHQKKNSDTL